MFYCGKTERMYKRGRFHKPPPHHESLTIMTIMQAQMPKPGQNDRPEQMIDDYVQ